MRVSKTAARQAKIPSYRKHKTGQGTVRIAGRDYYLGQHGTIESQGNYLKLVEAWVAEGSPRPWRGGDQVLDRPPELEGNAPVTVGQVILEYLDHVDLYYRKNGKPTGQVGNEKRALTFLHPLESRGLARDFGPRALARVRDAMVGDGLSRSTINKYVSSIKRMFKWAVALELVPADVWHGLQALPGLKRGRTPAPEAPRVLPVAEQDLEKTLPYLSPEVRAMVELQLLTGMRPGEVVTLRARDLRTQGPTWTYTPESHKTEHHGRVRVIPIGPKAQAILRPFLAHGIAGYLFAPAKAEARRAVRRRAARKTKLYPSHKKRKYPKRPRREFRDHYTTDAYGRAVRRACEAAGAEPWSPNRLRHSAATRLRSLFGIEAARVVLGHSSAVTSEIYAEMDVGKAMEIMAEVG